MSKRIWLAMLLVLAISGCMSRELSIGITFDQINGLKKGDRVLFEGNHIGKVSGISYQKEAAYRLEVTIAKDFRAAVTEHSNFIIISDPHPDHQKALEMIRIKEGGLPLEDGVTIKGSTRTTVLMDQMKRKLDHMVDGLKEQFHNFSEQLRKIPEKEEFKKLEQEMARLADEMKDLGQAARDKIQKEIIPRLKRDLERLKKRLKELGREQEIEPLETQMEKLKKT
jgi:hypothetical protein